MQTTEMTQQRREPRPGPRARPGWTGSRVVSLVAGLIVVLLGLGAAGVGAASAFAAGSEDTYLDLGAGGTYSTKGYALVTDSTNWRTELFGMVGTVRFQAQSASGKPIFVGVADRGAVRGYLDGVAYTTVHRNPGDAQTEHDGTAQPARPEEAVDWAAKARGSGIQALSWDAEQGALTLVAMNADGSPGVRAQVLASEVTLTRMSWWIPTLMIVIGLAGIAGGIVLIARPIRRARGR